MTLLRADEVTMADLAEVFNQAFADYMVEVYFTGNSFQEYVHRHMLDLGRSLVVDDGGLMVGILLCGHDGGTTWNAGMGVHPRWRRMGHGDGMLMAWLDEARDAGLSRALLEVIADNIPARELYLKRGFEELRSMPGFQGRPTWEKGFPLGWERIERLSPVDLGDDYREGHSWQKRRQVLGRLTGFECLRTRSPGASGEQGYLIYECTGGLMYVFDLTPNAAGQALLERAVRDEEPRLIRVVNAVDRDEERFYRRLGFRHWVTNIEMELML